MDVPAATLARGVVRAAHPEPSAVVTLVAVGLAVSAGLSAGTVALIGAAVLAGQLSIGWCNDVVDVRRDAAVARPDKPVATGVVPRGLVVVLAAAALVSCIALSVALGVAAASFHLVGVAAGWLYNLVLKRTPASAVAYALAFGLLPGVITGAAGAGWPPWWALVAGAAFGVGVHLANALPDLAEDAATGVTGLPQRLGHDASLRAAVVVLGVGAAAALVGPERDLLALAGGCVVAVVLTSAAVAGRRGDDRVAYRLAMLAGLLVVVALLTRGPALLG